MVPTAFSTEAGRRNSSSARKSAAILAVRTGFFYKIFSNLPQVWSLSAVDLQGNDSNHIKKIVVTAATSVGQPNSCPAKSPLIKGMPKMMELLRIAH